MKQKESSLKTILFLSMVIIITSCIKGNSDRNPNLKPGDCATVEFRKHEKGAWESKGPGYIFRVLEVGRRNYRVYQANIESKIGFETNIEIRHYSEWTDVYSQIDCEDALKLLLNIKTKGE